MRQHDAAVGSFSEVVQRDPKFRYGDAWLRASDAMVGLRRWDDALAELRGFLKINGSSVEGRVKLARALRRSGDPEAARAMRTEARTLFRELPPYQRRKQRGWYVRSFIP